MDLNAARKPMLASSSVFRDLPSQGNREVKKIKLCIRPMESPICD